MKYKNPDISEKIKAIIVGILIKNNCHKEFLSIKGIKKSKTRMHIDWKRVFSLPQIDASTFKLLAAIMFLEPSTIKSLTIKKITTETNVYLKNARKIKVVVIMILSANGSNNFPNVVAWLFFLAKYPSIKSVIIAIKKIIPVPYKKYCPLFWVVTWLKEKSTYQVKQIKFTIKGITRKILNIVNLFGKFIFILFF